MAVKTKSVYRCTECGGESLRWAGQCPTCGEWNTLVETTAAKPKARAGSFSVERSAVRRLDEISGEDSERSQRALELEALLVMADPAREQADADEAVADDHDGGENRVARQARLLRPAGDHDGDDERHLNDRDGERQHQGAVGLTHLMGHHFGMVHCGDRKSVV